MHKSPFTDNIGCVLTRATEQQGRGIKSMPVFIAGTRIFHVFFVCKAPQRLCVYVLLHWFYRCICCLSFIFSIRHMVVDCMGDIWLILMGDFTAPTLKMIFPIFRMDKTASFALILVPFVRGCICSYIQLFSFYFNWLWCFFFPFNPHYLYHTHASLCQSFFSSLFLHTHIHTHFCAV